MKNKQPIGADCVCDLGSEKHYHPECEYLRENKDWREEFKKIEVHYHTNLGRPNAFSELLLVDDEQEKAIIFFIESLLKSKQEEIEKAIDGMKGYVPHLPTIDPSLGELIDQDIGFVEHINGQLLFKREVKPIISNILK